MEGAEHHKWYKILRKEMIHQGVQYSYDISMCVPSGMYFCRLQSIPRWLDLYEDNETIAEVHFLPQSTVEHLGAHKSRIDWFILKNPVPIPRFIKRYFEPIQVLARSPFLIRYMENPSPILQYYAVEENPHALACIKNPKAEVCELAVQKNPFALRYVHFHSIDIYRIAIPKNGLALGCVEEKFWTTPLYEKEMIELSLAAVNENGLALQFVRNQTAEICEAAVSQNGYALPMVWPALRTPEVYRRAWKQNDRALEFASKSFRDVAERRNIIIH
jgi:hypothetical protein